MSGRDLDRCNVNVGGGAEVAEMSAEGASALVGVMLQNLLVWKLSVVEVLCLQLVAV